MSAVRRIGAPALAMLACLTGGCQEEAGLHGAPAAVHVFKPIEYGEQAELARIGLPEMNSGAARTYEPLAIHVDPDRDGLPTYVENLIGTNPNDPDTDGDKLLDGWEFRGVNGIDLHAKGADPLNPDIFVQMDYMTDNVGKFDCRPSDGALEMVCRAFLEAPYESKAVRQARRESKIVRQTQQDKACPTERVTTCPEEDLSTGYAESMMTRPGIRLHLEWGHRIPLDKVLAPAKEEFIDIMVSGKRFPPERRPVYHYMIWAWQYKGFRDLTSSGFSMPDVTKQKRGLFMPGQFFCVTVGPIRRSFGGMDRVLAEGGTFMHELGHNLGLPHDGAGVNNRTFKPNHLSVMNYAFQFIGVLRGREQVLDYQRIDHVPALDEGRLIESRGLGAGSSGYHTVVHAGDSVAVHRADGWIDWNANKIEDPKPVSQDINRDKRVTRLCATGNEWDMLCFDGGEIGGRTKAALAWPDQPATRFTIEENPVSIETAVQFNHAIKTMGFR